MLKAALQLRLGQQLTMTPQLQQAIRLLQLPTIELQAHIRELLESNVMLEQEEESENGTIEAVPGIGAVAEAPAEIGGETATDTSAQQVEVVDDGWGEQPVGPAENPWSPGDDDREQDIADSQGKTLREHLLWQLELAQLDPRERAIARALVDAINDDGYLGDSLEEVAATLRPDVECGNEELERVLAVVQALDPAGVGARSVGECLDLQLAQLDPATEGLELARRIVATHLEQVAGNQHEALRRALGCTEGELAAALALVRGCQPRPGATVHTSAAEYVVPDVLVRRTARGWSVEVNPSTLPRVRLNQGYADLIGRGNPHAGLRTQLQEARWLLKSLEIRHDTLTRVARSIVERQTEFLDHGEEHMRPMILRDIAEAIDMHESTVSRITSGKYMHTPRGVYELRYFFSSQVEGSDGSGTSSTAIRAKIRKLIRDEDPGSPLSDSRIAEILAGEGIPVARRTVAKYRESVGLAPSNERKRPAAGQVQ